MDAAPNPRDTFKQGLAAVWDAGAVSYDDLPGHGLLGDDEAQAWSSLLTDLLGDARRPRTPIRRVLDVGTGTGVLAIIAADLGHDVTGLDLSTEMLRRAADKARDLHLPIRFFQGDAEAPPFGAGSFDTVISRHLLWTLPDPDAAVARWAELVVPGGFVAIVDGFRPPGGPIRRVLALLQTARSAFTRRSGAAATHDYSPDQVAHLPLAHQRDEHAAERCMRRAGLRDVQTRLLGEIDTAERAHRDVLGRAASDYHHYLTIGRRPDPQPAASSALAGQA